MVDEQIQLTIDAFNNLVGMLGGFSTDAMASINAWVDDTIQMLDLDHPIRDLPIRASAYH